MLSEFKDVTMDFAYLKFDKLIGQGASSKVID